jgi:hypothetical protein
MQPHQIMCEFRQTTSRLGATTAGGGRERSRARALSWRELRQTTHECRCTRGFNRSRELQKAWEHRQPGSWVHAAPTGHSGWQTPRQKATCLSPHWLVMSGMTGSFSLRLGHWGQRLDGGVELAVAGTLSAAF